MASVRPLTLRSAKGLKLAADIHIPDGAGPFPAALVIHGFMGFKDENHITRFAEDLARAGFVALRFDTSGFGRSEGSPASDFRVSTYLGDIEIALQYLRSRPDVAAGKIAVCGHSLGASLAIITAAENDVFACSAVQPSTKLTRPGPRSVEHWGDSMKFECECPQYPEFSLPKEFAVDADRFDCREWVGRVRCPLQISYGTADTKVPPENTLAIYERAPKGTELVRLDGYDHDFRNDPEKLAAASAMVAEFLLKQLR